MIALLDPRATAAVLVGEVMPPLWQYFSWLRIRASGWWTLKSDKRKEGRRVTPTWPLLSKLKSVQVTAANGLRSTDGTSWRAGD